MNANIITLEVRSGEVGVGRLSAVTLEELENLGREYRRLVAVAAGGDARSDVVRRLEVLDEMEFGSDKAA